MSSKLLLLDTFLSDAHVWQAFMSLVHQQHHGVQEVKLT
jgi:hypothetical protein